MLPALLFGRGFSFGGWGKDFFMAKKLLSASLLMIVNNDHNLHDPTACIPDISRAFWRATARPSISSLMANRHSLLKMAN